MRLHAPFKANVVRACDFVFDTTAEGRNIKCLTVVDEYTRECLAIDVAGSIRSKRVIEVLSKLVSVHGAPLSMRSDNGPEFVSHAILEWIVQRRPSPQHLELLDPSRAQAATSTHPNRGRSIGMSGSKNRAGHDSPRDMPQDS